MTTLLWDQTGEKMYETGLDRGVLYLANGNGVVWNGLTGVDEDASDVTVTPYYLDGLVYYQDRSASDFSATIKAFTYPDEFLEFDGYQQSAPGLSLGSQPVTSRFGISYRTLIGDDIQGTELGYKIHVVYNLTATPANVTRGTLSKSANPIEFSWKVVGVPEVTPGFRPTTHAVIDSRFVRPSIFEYIEGVLYGTETEAARLPSLAELMFVLYTDLYTLVDNGDGSWTATGPPDVLEYLDATTFQITSAAALFLTADKYQLSSAHSSHDTDAFDNDGGSFDDGTI